MIDKNELILIKLTNKLEDIEFRLEHANKLKEQDPNLQANKEKIMKEMKDYMLAQVDLKNLDLTQLIRALEAIETKIETMHQIKPIGSIGIRMFENKAEILNQMQEQVIIQIEKQRQELTELNKELENQKNDLKYDDGLSSKKLKKKIEEVINYNNITFLLSNPKHYLNKTSSVFSNSSNEMALEDEISSFGLQ